LELLFQSGCDLASTGDYHRALRTFTKMLEIDPEQPHAMFNAAVMCDLLGETSSAIRVLKETIQLAPQLPDSSLYLGKIYYRAKNYPIAQRYFRAAIRHDINNKQAYQHYFDIATKTGQQVTDEQTDLVFYIIGGEPFHGHTLEKQGIGGAETAFITLTRQLAQMGYRIIVFTDCDKPGIYDGIHYLDLVDFYIYRYANPIKILVAVRSVKPFLQGTRATKKLLWIHDSPNVQLTPQVLDQIDCVIAVSKWQKEQWQHEYHIPENKIIVIPNAVDSQLFQTKSERYRKKKLVYLSPPQRGLESLLNLFPEIRRKYPEAELSVFNYDSQNGDDLSFSGKDLTNVRFMGNVHKKRLAKELRSAKLLAYPTACMENFCLSAVEAQAAGVPVITSNQAALAETVESDKTGFLIDGLPGSPEYDQKFIDKALQLLSDEEQWSTMSKQAQERTIRLYDVNLIAQKWKELFDRLHHCNSN